MTWAELAQQSYAFDAASVAENSRKTYETGIRTYETVMNTEFHVNPCPVTQESIRVFIMNQKTKGNAFATLRGYICAIVWHFNQSLLPDITKSMSFKLFKSGLRRVMLGDGPLNRKEPLTSVHLVKILTKFSGLSEQEREFLLLCSLCYYGFLRIGEALSLTAGDIVFSNGIVSVTVRKSKTDQTGRGETVPITDNGLTISPARFLPQNLQTPKYVIKNIRRQATDVVVWLGLNEEDFFELFKEIAYAYDVDALWSHYRELKTQTSHLILNIKAHQYRFVEVDVS
jgi:integrase